MDLHSSVTPIGVAAIASFLTERYVSVQADGANVYFALSPTNDVALVVSGTGSPGATACVLIPDGQTHTFLYTAEDYRYLSYITASGTGSIRVWASSPKAST